MKKDSPKIKPAPRVEALTDAQRARDFEADIDGARGSGVELSSEAKKLAREAETDPGLAEMIGRTRSERAQQVLTAAVRQRGAPKTQAEYLQRMQAVADKSDSPDRKAQMQSLISGISARVGMDRSAQRSGHEQGPDIER